MGHTTILLVLLALGIAAVIYSRRRDGGDKDLIQSQLYSIAGGMVDFYVSAATPDDLLSHPEFNRGVELLTRPVYGRDGVVAYVTGSNEILACMALEALRRRGDLGELGRHLLTSLPAMEERVRWLFLLHLQTTTDADQRLVADILAYPGGDWNFPADMALLHDIIERRAEGGEELTFGGLLGEMPAERLELVHQRLQMLADSRLAPMMAEVVDRRGESIDTAYLGSVGRVWPAADEGDAELVAHQAYDDAAEELAAAIGGDQIQSALLVGESGVGKTALVRLVARRLQASGWTIFEAGPQQLLAGQVYIGQLEERLQALVGRLRGRRVLWIVPDFHGLAFAGRHQYSEISALDSILPFVERGELAVLTEIQPQAWEKLQVSQPRCRTAFAVKRIRPLSDRATLELARSWSQQCGGPADGPLVDEATLAEAWQLAQQYLGDRASPGNLMYLLKSARDRVATGVAGPATRVTIGDLLTGLSQLSGLPVNILDQREGLDVESLRDLFHERVLGQPEAVDCLVERVAMIKAGVTDSTRPYGVFLFAGPTGTGKTEIAKTLAEFLFGSAERMLRLDMSEYQTPAALDALLGTNEADRAGSLVSRIRAQPFTVVLLDEFEKAHPQIWDVFLQVFDDGRLTDRRGVTADLRHAIIILTSNLGGVISSGISLGFSRVGGAFSAGDVHRALEGSFRKEFLNRIDRVVVFQPLGRATMRAVLEKELERVFERRGLRTREWAVEFEDSAIDFLLDRGFTPDLGARPLKRAVERYLLAPLALTIVGHRFPDGDQFLFVRSDGTDLQVDFVDPDAPAGDAEPVESAGRPAPRDDLRLEGIALQPAGSGEEVECLRRHYDGLCRRIEGEPWRGQKDEALAALSKPEFWQSAGRFATLGQAEYLDRIEAGLRTAGSLLERLDGGQRRRSRLPRDVVGSVAMQLYTLEAACDGIDADIPRDAFLLVETCGDPGGHDIDAAVFTERVVEMYRGWARKRRMRVTSLTEARSESGTLERVLLSVTGYAAFALLRHEDGLHVLERPAENGRRGSKNTVRVRVAPQPDDEPAQGRAGLEAQAASALAAESRGEIKVVRRYRDAPSPLVRDAVRNWRTGRIDAVLAGDFDLFGATDL